MNLLKEISQNKNIKKPVIYGLKGLQISQQEIDFFRKSSPIGFILFARNIQDKIQLKKLCDDLKDLMGGQVLILIDQEGGRVQRIKPPLCSSYPPIFDLAKNYQQDPDLTCRKIYQNYQNIASDLGEFGINVNCAPLLDILSKETHDVIGNRALGDNCNDVAKLAQIVCDSLLSKNIYPVIKHIPGHGRAKCDSHLDLPIVDISLKELQESDFVPFKQLKDQKFAMTAHILYSQIDDSLPATLSKKVIDVIRNQIDFQNIIMTDDLSMKALKGSFEEKTIQAINAGCDVILHCNGDMQEMVAINNSLNNINDSLLSKLTK